MKRAPRHAFLAVPLSFVAALLVALGLATVAPPPVAHGATYTTVNFGGDTDDGACQPGAILPVFKNCTLREAINAANADAAADTITFTGFAAAAGIISPTSALPTITQPLTINGAIPVSPVTGSDKIKIDGASAGAADGLYAYGAGGSANTVPLTVQNLIITRFAGNGIEFRNTGGSVSGSFIGTDASGTSGLGNTAGAGGGIYIEGGPVTLTNSTVSGNTASAVTNHHGGGGIYISYGTVTLTNSTVSGNTAPGGGGGIKNNNGTLTLTNSTVSGNTAGGGIWNLGNLTLTNSTVSGNTAGGGGIRNNGGLTLTNSTVSGNTGRGIDTSFPGTATLTNSTVSGNTNGGINNASGTLTLTNSTVSGNSTTGDGGGINNRGSTQLTNMTLTNSTVSGNTATGDGGGIYISYAGTLPHTLANSTITNNTADSDGNGTGGGGGIYRDNGTVNLKNTILAGNTDLSAVTVDPDCFGALNSQGYNLIQIVSPGCTVGGVTTGNVTGQSADLGPLALNAPGTTQTHALLAGSPAIDAGSPDCPPPAADQRGVARPQGSACDIGAYESPFTAPTPSPTPTPSPSPTPTPVGQTPTPAPTATPTPTATPVGQTPTPTPTATPTPTPTPVGQTPTPTPTATPIGQTPMPTPTATPIGQTPSPTPVLTPTPAASPSPTPVMIEGADVTCDGHMDMADVIALLEHSADLDPEPAPSCPEIGTDTGGGKLLGDADCNGAVNTRDALQVLLAIAHLPLLPDSCVS